MTVELDHDPVDENERVDEEHYAMAGQEHRDVISRLYEGLKLAFVGRTDRLVMAEVDLYPPGERVKMIPDVAVVFGLPQASMSSYRVGRDGPAPDVVLEVVSPLETDDARSRKLDRYAAMGAREVWFLHLHPAVSLRYRLVGATWAAETQDVCEALDGVRFGAVDGRLEPYLPDGSPFPAGWAAADERVRLETARADGEAARADGEAARAERLAARLRELGVDPERV